VVAIFAGALSLTLWAAGLTQWNVILAAVAAATLGAVLETARKDPSQPGAQP